MLAIVDEAEVGIRYMGQNLVDHRLDTAAGKDIFNIAFDEIGNANGAELAFFIGILQSPPGFPVPFFVAVGRLVHGFPRLWMIMRSKYSRPIFCKVPSIEAAALS